MNQTSSEVRLERTYKKSIEKVWQAISTADAISKWFIQADFKAEVNFNYTFTHEQTQKIVN